MRTSIPRIYLLRFILGLLTTLTAAGMATPSAAPVTLAASNNPMIHQAGTSIVDGTGQPFHPRGINLGGWLHLEGYLIGGTTSVSQTMLTNDLSAAVGPAAVATWSQQLIQAWITDADMARIAGLGYNTVRIPFNYRLLEDDAAPYQYKASGWAAMDYALALSEKYGLHVVLDLASAPGGQSKYSPADPGPTSLWAAPDDQARTVALWQAIAARYAGHTSILGYDLLNEPDPTSKSQLTTLYSQIIAAIRTVDPQHMVILEGQMLSGDLSPLVTPLSDNQALSFHLYQFGTTDTRQGMLSIDLWNAQKAGSPLYAGEFGENSTTWDSSTQALFETPANGISGWTFWTWKRVATANPNAVVFTAPKNWQWVMAWVSGWVAQPSKTYTQTAMNDFLQSVALNRSQENTSLESALHTAW